MSPRSSTPFFASSRMSRRPHYAVGGALDPTFGVGGKVTTPFAIPAQDFGRATAIDSQGRIVVAGYSTGGSNSDFAVTRLTTAGALDPSFGGTGVATVDFGTDLDQAIGVAVDSQNRIVVVGYSYDGTAFSFAVARLTDAGGLDNSFNGDGKQSFRFGPSSTNLAFSVAFDSLGRIVVGGYTLNGQNAEFAVARLTTAGALDVTFNGSGQEVISFAAGSAYGYAVAVDSFDRVVIAGTIAGVSGSDIGIARLTVSGALDSSFDGDGKQSVDFGPGVEAWAVAVDSLETRGRHR